MGIFQSRCWANQGVREAVIAPPIWQIILTMEENTSEFFRAKSVDTDQNELIEKYWTGAVGSIRYYASPQVECPTRQSMLKGQQHNPIFTAQDPRERRSR